MSTTQDPPSDKPRVRNVRHDAYRALRMDRQLPTAQYSTINAAFAAAAEHHGLGPSDVRVLVAVYDLDVSQHPTRSADIAAALMMHDSGVRRALLTLYGRKMAESRTQGQPGVQADIRLLARGSAVVGTFYRFLEELHAHPDQPDELAVQASEQVDRLPVTNGAPAE